MKKILSMFIAAVSAALPVAAEAGTFSRVSGGLESLTAEWTEVAGATAYEVLYSTGDGLKVKADEMLVRRYPDCMRLDLPGLSAGDYGVEVNALGADGSVIDSFAAAQVEVIAHTREGFAFADGIIPGAYGSDGKLKEGADVIYVSSSTVNTVSLDVIKDKKGNRETVTGLAAILELKGKGFDHRPLAIRIIGQVCDTEFEGLKDGNYLNLQGNNATDRRLENVTVEGVGSDATLYGYGICFKRTRAIEVRNVGIMLFGDDAVSMDTDNSNIWLHNIDFFYGRPGRDADQVKGDGSIDMKYRSTDITISYNHFWDSGKVMGCGGTTGEDENLRITFHHNWFDHADSRCPRLHYTTAHIYNNYYDAVSVYSIGNTTESSAFVEGNYFRNCKRPMMISGQGTDAYDKNTGTYTLKGTFSGQDGGMTKAFDNTFAENVPALVWHTGHATQFDAYLASTRDEIVPEEIKSVKGAWKYSNFDTEATFYTSVPDRSADVPDKVTSLAGRVDGGDFRWEFDNAVDDEDHSVNTALKKAVTDYRSRLVSIQGVDNQGSSAISEIMSDENGGDTVYYDLSGRSLGHTRPAAGVYIVKTGNRVYKAVVK